MKAIRKLECKEISLKKFTKHIHAHGFKYERESGGHMIYKNQKTKTTFVLPVHRIVQTGIIWQFNNLVSNNYRYNS